MSRLHLTTLLLLFSTTVRALLSFSSCLVILLYLPLPAPYRMTTVVVRLVLTALPVRRLTWRRLA
jgi:hypothetical protein